MHPPSRSPSDHGRLFDEAAISVIRTDKDRVGEGVQAELTKAMIYSGPFCHNLRESSGNPEQEAVSMVERRSSSERANG